MATSAGTLLRGAVAVSAIAAAALALAGCGGSAPGPSVPSLTGGSTATAGPNRAGALHAAAQCIREHGIPSYSDPVLTPSGQVYSDSRSIENASQSALGEARQDCAALLATAQLNPLNEPPAPPQLVQAGVRSAECLRAHGLPGVHDPTARTGYTPGHGFSMAADELPSGGKLDPAFQRASGACRPALDAEIRASTLTSLGHDG